MTAAEQGGRVALVSGATSGIGRAVAARLCRDGFHVIGFGLAATVADRGGTGDVSGASLRVVEVDVRRPEQVSALVEDVRAEHGRIDVLCNAAGIKLIGDALTSGDDVWEETFAVNVRGLAGVVRAVLPTMIAQRSGSIVNFGSPSALADPGSIAYGASKAAVAAMTTTLALAHVGDHVRVNLVVPGSTRSGMNADRPESVNRELGRANVAGRINEPEDVAEVVAFLASDAAATVSGARIDVGSVCGVLPTALLADRGSGGAGG